jgi:hypothetical protein
MTHHHGMSLAALDNVLNDRPISRRFMADPQMRAAEPLLQERVPRAGLTMHPHSLEPSAPAEGPEGNVRLRVFEDPALQAPEVHSSRTATTT